MADGYTDDELFTPVEKPKTKSSSPATGYTDEELSQPIQKKPDSERKVLDNSAEGDGWMSSAAKGLATAGAHVVAGLDPYGYLGSARDLATMGAAGIDDLSRKVVSAVGIEPQGGNPGYQELYAEKQKEWPQAIQNLPNAQDAYDQIFGNKIGEYKPESTLGRMAMAGTEAVLARNPKKLLDPTTYIAPFAAGAAAQGATEITGNPVIGMGVGMGAGPAAAKGVQRVQDTINPKPAAAELARRVTVESPDDLAKADANLASPGSTVPGMRPNTAMAAQDQGIAAAANKVVKGTPDERPYVKNVEANQQAHDAATADTGSNIDSQLETQRQGIYGHVDPDTRLDTSSNTNRIVQHLWDTDKASERSAWEAWRGRGDGVVNIGKVTGALEDYFNGLTARERDLVSKDFEYANTDLSESARRGWADVAALQDARSALLEKARNAASVSDARVYNAAAEHLRGLITDPGNYRFASGAPSRAWDAARQATDDFHSKWDDKTTAWAKDPDKAGSAFLDRVFNGTDRDARTAELMAKVGSDPNVVNELTDWHLGKLTEGNTKAVKPTDVDRYINKYKSAIDQIPGLEDKLRAVGSTSIEQQLSTNWQKAQQAGPDKLLDFMNTNRSEMTALADKTGNRAAVDGIEQAARQLNALKGPGAVNGETLNKLIEGRTATLLYGASLPGAIGKAAALALVAKLVGHEHIAELALAVAGGHALHGPMGRLLEPILKNRVQEQALGMLRKAVQDPAEWQRLRNLPPREAARAIFGSSLGEDLKSSAIGAVEGTQAPPDE